MMFRTRPKLLTIMQMAGANGQLFTADQVVYFLGKYIEQRKLYDPVNKRIIKCSNDLLGEVFKVSQFTVTDFKNLWKLIFPCLIPATRREMSSGDHVEHQEEGNEQLPWWYFISKNNDTDDVATEGGSYADGETVGIADTDVSDSEEEGEVIEYEPFETDSEASNDTELNLSDDEPDVGEISTLKQFQESDDDDTNTIATDFSMDSDISLEELWPCEECKTKNSPKVGYCQRCWKFRKGWTENVRMQRSATDPALPTFNIEEIRRERGVDVCDGNSEGPVAKKRHLDSTAMATSSSQESTTDSNPSSSSSFSASSASDASYPGLCNICRSNPNDATIVHKNTGHQFCCYRCAKTLKKKGKSCPVCRLPIMLVIKNFIVQF